MYVTLEPCCHYGKTPPCTQVIIEQKIAKVVIGSRDPNPKVAGKGAAILKNAGVMVEEDFLKEECDELNDVFFHYITTKTPYVVMKYAMTADGKIATYTGASKWITGEEARKQVQHMRHHYMGIMVGIGTVLADDPMLNVRLEGGRSPVRIICDSKLRIPLSSRICKSAGEYQTIVAYAGATAAVPESERLKEKKTQLEDMGIQVISVPDGKGTINLVKLMKILGEMEIDSILLEGGGTLNDSALRSQIVQEVDIFIAPKLFGGEKAKSAVEGVGVAVPKEAVRLEMKQVKPIGEDLFLRYRVKKVDTCLQES